MYPENPENPEFGEADPENPENPEKVCSFPDKTLKKTFLQYMKNVMLVFQLYKSI